MKELIQLYTQRFTEVEQQIQLALSNQQQAEFTSGENMVNNPIVVQLTTLKEIYKEFIEKLHQLSIKQQDEELIIMAQQQLTGYIVHMRGGTEKELIESMNLSIDEWTKIREEAWIPGNVLNSIDSYFIYKNSGVKFS